MEMSNKKQQIPAIRFNDFTDAWEQCKFSQYYKVSSGFAFKLEDYTEIGVPIVNGESIQHGVVSSNNFNYLPDSFRTKYPQYVLNTDDIVLGLNRPVTNGELKIAKIPEKLDKSLLYQRAGKVEYIKTISKKFSFILLDKEILNYTLKEAVGSDQPFISTTKLADWKMFVPSSNDEMEKVGVFFNLLNNVIALHQRQLNDYKKLKKSMMQKIFNQEICFKDPDDNDYPRWDEKQLGELADIEKGTQINRDSLSQIESKELYPVYNGGITPSGFHSDYNREPGSVIVSEGGNSCGYVNYVSERFWSGGHSYTIKKKNEKINTKYLFQLLKFNETKIMALRVGTGLPNIQKPSLSKYGLLVSSDESEQQKIANFLSIFDVRIEKSSQKVELLKEQKKRLMYQMFV